MDKCVIHSVQEIDFVDCHVRVHVEEVKLFVGLVACQLDVAR